MQCSAETFVLVRGLGSNWDILTLNSIRYNLQNCWPLIKGTVRLWSAWEWFHWKSLGKDINRCRFLIFNFSFEYLASKFWAPSHKNESNLLFVWITVCIYARRNLISSRILSPFSMLRPSSNFYVGLRITVSEPWSKLYRQGTIVVWIAGCWYSSNILLTSHNPKNNCWLYRIFGARFGRKDHGS